MEGYKHFSHPHTLSFHKSLEAAQLTCTGCSFPCTGTPIYACRKCKFFLHDRCFNASRSLTHPLHPDHPLSLFQSPTYTSGSFICNSCNKTGSGFCFCCSNCDFDLHIHCAYNTLNPKPSPNPNPNPSPAYNTLNPKPSPNSNPNPSPNPDPPPNQIKLKSHPNHPLKHFPKPPLSSGTHSCDVCGTRCDANSALYRCDICDYDVHLGCTSLPEIVRREDHAHTLKLLHVNPFSSFKCDVCSGMIAQSHCMYYCTSGCDYGMHVKCVPAKVSEQAEPMNEMTFQVEMFKLQNQMKVHQMMIDTMLLGNHGLHRNRYYRY